MGRINGDVLSLICCPNCGKDLIADDLSLSCKGCNSVFREKEGILVLISSELEAELRC